MTTYKIAKEITIERQEGDTGNIEIKIPDIIDVSAMEIRFHVVNSASQPLTMLLLQAQALLQKLPFPMAPHRTHTSIRL